MKLQYWLEAARPKTLPAGIAPVLVGTAYAFYRGGFHLWSALAAFGVAMALQIGVNLANDYFDHVRGIDTEERQGPRRATAAGLIPPGVMRIGMAVTFGLAALLGAALVLRAGWVVLLPGAVAILAALAYSGGPFPLASHGLGDLFVFIFFGPVAVAGTYYVQSLRLDAGSILLSLAPGFLSAAILVVNNHRDRATDEKAGKRTLSVVLGERGSRWLYASLVVAGFAMAIPLALWFGLPMLFAWAAAPLAVAPTREIFGHAQGTALNGTLAKTARLTLVYCALTAAVLAVMA